MNDRTTTQERQHGRPDGDSGWQQANQPQQMAGMAGTGAMGGALGATSGGMTGAAAGGTVGMASGGVIGWGVGMACGAIVGLVTGIFLGLAIANSPRHSHD